MQNEEDNTTLRRMKWLDDWIWKGRECKNIKWGTQKRGKEASYYETESVRSRIQRERENKMTELLMLF